MFVPLPNLDDRRWSDLVDEGRTLIPVYSPAWTDHNESDPGITMLELLAWIADSDIYRANRIPDKHTLAFLALLGISPEPPSAARAPVQFTLKSAPAVHLPASTELDAAMLDGSAGKFRLRNAVTVLPATLQAVQVQSGGRFRDVTGAWTHGKPISIFGESPQVGDALYLGFKGTLAPGDLLNVYVGLQGDSATAAARQRLLDDVQERIEACHPRVTCGPQPPPPMSAVLPPHHSAVVIFEEQTQAGIWRSLDAVDNTRSMTLSGTVSLTIGAPPAALRTGAVIEPLRYIRGRLAVGSLDAAPVALRILENAAEAEQCSPVCEQWAVAAGVVAIGTPPTPGQTSWLRVAFNASGSVAGLEFGSAQEAIHVTVLAYKPATANQAGSITVEAYRVAVGTGAPNQLYKLQGPRLCAGALKIYTLESDGPRVWSQVETFVASGPAHKHFSIDPEDAEVLFGDGQHGRVPPAGAIIVAIACVTNGAAGNVAAGAIRALDAGPRNASLFDVAGYSARLLNIGNPDLATGGADTETMVHAEGRASLLVNKTERAVTLADCEELALETPGTVLARAAAIANYCPGMQCYSAPGFITVVIVPTLPAGRPVPSAGLRNAVAAYLNRRRVIGTRIEVTGPEYLEVAVNAAVKAGIGQNKSVVRSSVDAALRGFLDPLTGGPDRTGWPLGRGVYISEVLETIAKVAGVDHVVSLQLAAAGCGAQCGDICLDPLALAVSGAHRIQVS
jgi:predicted phage baseplate assembly protein